MLSYDELFSLRGKTAFVSGGSKGLGRGIAEALLRGGARVLIASRTENEAAETAAELSGHGDCEGFRGDVGTADGVKSLADQIGQRTGLLDILVNNAGVTWGAPLGDFPFEAWSRVMSVNVAGLFSLTQSLLPMLKIVARQDAPARVVNVGSAFGSVNIAEGGYSYAASKAAVHHLTRILANELASQSITVNAIAPGPFESRMTAFAFGKDGSRDRIASTLPLGRVGEPDDLAGALAFLCSRAGSYVTGMVMPLDGGLSIEARQHVFHAG